MKWIAAGIMVVTGTLGGSWGAGAAAAPPGHGLAPEPVDCTDGVSGEAIRSNGLAVWVDGSQWLVTSFTSGAVSWSNPAGNGAAKGRTVTCEAPDGAVITLVEVQRPPAG